MHKSLEHVKGSGRMADVHMITIYSSISWQCLKFLHIVPQQFGHIYASKWIETFFWGGGKFTVHGCDHWGCKQFLCNLSSNTWTCISAEMDAGELDRRDLLYTLHSKLEIRRFMGFCNYHVFFFYSVTIRAGTLNITVFITLC